MRIYLASRYGRRVEMMEHAAELVRLGHEVVSSWIDGHHETRPDVECDSTYWERCAWASEDLHDLDQADTLVAFTEAPGTPDASRGGRHAEFGYAAAKRKRLIVIGPPENIFYDLLGTRFDRWEKYLDILMREDSNEHDRASEAHGGGRS